MKNLISLILIFSSLAVIVFILGKKIPRLRDVRKKGNPVASREKIGKIGTLLASVLFSAKKILVFAAEQVVKKAKKILHLVHFWLIKTKRGKKENEELGELEAKQELIKEEEKNLEKVINEDLADGQSEVVAWREENEIIFVDANKTENKSKPTVGLTNRSDKDEIKTEKNPPAEKQTEKIEKFFARKNMVGDDVLEHLSTLKEKKSRFAFITNLFKRKKEGDEGSSGEIIGSDEENGFYQQNGRFGDGIVKVEKTSGSLDGSSSLIKEVVSIKKKSNHTDEDEELGIDRSILEKKIINKISQNPKDIENYRQLGELYIKMKNYQDAQEAYKFILKVSPRDIDSKRKLEKIKLLKRING